VLGSRKATGRPLLSKKGKKKLGTVSMLLRRKENWFPGEAGARAGTEINQREIEGGKSWSLDPKKKDVAV